jgi:carbonic anhydrase/acetyltransferase-like protein (isoleucine patch superfamily)
VALYRLGDQVPQVHPEAFVAPEAVIIGNVTIGARASVWFGAVLRGDHGRIEVGEETSIQDGTVVHTGEDFPTLIGKRCVIGHMAHLEGCVIEDDSLVGSGSVVLHWARVCSFATVGANAVVPNHMVVPSGALALGIPAKIREGASSAEGIAMGAKHYVENAKLFNEQLFRIE